MTFSSKQYQPKVVSDLTAVIPISTATSGEIDLSGTTLCGIITPSAMTGTTLTLTMAHESGGTFVSVRDGYNNAITITIATNESRYYQIDPAITAGLRFIKIVSGGTEAAERTLRLITRAV